MQKDGIREGTEKHRKFKISMMNHFPVLKNNKSSVENLLTKEMFKYAGMNIHIRIYDERQCQEPKT